MNIQQIPAESITHLYYSFGYVEPSTYRIIPMKDNDGTSAPEHTFKDVVELKERNPQLKVIVALGGW